MRQEITTFFIYFLMATIVITAYNYNTYTNNISHKDYFDKNKISEIIFSDLRDRERFEMESISAYYNYKYVNPGIMKNIKLGLIAIAISIIIILINFKYIPRVKELDDSITTLTGNKPSYIQLIALWIMSLLGMIIMKFQELRKKVLKEEKENYINEQNNQNI